MTTDQDKPVILSANLFPVVGIGASAGGLEAFKRLLGAIPRQSGIAYVLVQHLDPSHESLLPELLQKVSPIPVMEITDDIIVQPDHVYIIPSNKMLMANDGVLLLSPRPPKSKNERNLPIDLFFTSLAEVHQTYAIGVVLSGTGSDGTQGLKAIKDLGGITFAQDEASAAYDGMPRSAVQAGVVDFILPPEDVPKKLLEIKQQISLSEEELQNFPQPDEAVFKKILALLRVRKVTDFTYYKQTTIRRRILRRMALNQQETPAAYLAYLQANRVEQDALFQDLLIPVTGFFRDAKVFENLCTTVFPHLVENKANTDSIRIWVAGCSTGQEAYSVAICLKEFLGNDPGKVQIFATDISEPAIAKARNGIYTKSEVEEVTEHRRQEFFTHLNGRYQINKNVRDMCVFAVHNFLKDPPFGKIDFVSCRNVLIYMEPYLQKKALTTFHYALNPKGFLLLGKSETSSAVPDLFTAVGKQDKLFSRRDVPGRFMHVVSQRSEQSIHDLNAPAHSGNSQTDFQKVADDIMLARYTPASVVINAAMDIVHFRGNTGTYLEQAPGKPSHNLLKMARNGLAFELRTLVHKARKERTTVIKENIPLQLNGSQHSIAIEATLLPNTVEPHYLIIFHDRPIAVPLSTGTAKTNTTSKAKIQENELRIRQLEQELAQSREDMRSITEDQEAANEELQSANEELLSGSEELQSLNEELETSKEELQSTNEELTVVTQGMLSLNEQITEARDYAEAIVATIHEPMLVLDKSLRIRSANKAFFNNFRVSQEDTKGALLYDLDQQQWNIPRLRASLENIIPQNTQFHDFELSHNFPGVGEKILLLNASRIVQKSHDDELILLAINDITEVRMKVIQLQLKEKELLRKDISDTKAKKAKLEKAVKKRTRELKQANQALAVQNEEIEKRESALTIANRELVFQNEEKEKRAAELLIANTELKSFAFVSSHDLQEPLRKILTFAQLILDKEQAVLSAKGKDHFQRLHTAAMRMQQLITDLLAFSSVNTAERKFEKIDLRLIVEEVKNEFQEIIAEKNATIVATDFCTTRVILFQFRQLLQNLLGNALKYADPARPPHIVIKSEMTAGSKLLSLQLSGQKRISSDLQYCHLSIADNGIGFDPQYKDRIFELFQRLHGKDAYAGTGIGLAIAKKIVENHDGIITATGEPGKGARFDIYLPAAGKEQEVAP